MPKPAKAKEAESTPMKMVYMRLDLAIYEHIQRIAEREQRPWSFVASRMLKEACHT